MRQKIIHAAIVVIFSLVGIGIFNLEIIQGERFKYLGDKNCIRFVTQRGTRGKIFDRRGNVLVGNNLAYDITILPQERKRDDKTLMAVSKILGVSFSELKAKFIKGYVSLFTPVVVAENIDIKKVIALGELKSDYSGIIIQSRPLRNYPFGKLLCHVIGYLSQIDHWRLTKLEDYGYKTKDIVGFGGIEEKYDYYLREHDGALSIEVDHRGKFIRVVGFIPPQDGKDIELTLDLNIQRIVEDTLGNTKGSVIIMDPYTGEIIAMANSPSYNPSIFVDKTNYVIANLADSALVNRAICGLYPPGSVFKMAAACAGLETGKIYLSTTYFCAGSLKIGNRNFGCWDTHHEENLADAIAHSCDVFFYRTGLLLGPQVLHDYAVKFGLSKPTGIDLPYEAGGLVPDPAWKKIHKLQNWFDGDTANFVIGQGNLLVTPLQVARLMAVFANNGTLVTPYVVKKIGDKDITGYQKKGVSIPIKKSIINYVRENLKGVVSESSGTANVLADLPLSIAGKTGTAQIAHNQTHGWFAGFFPFKSPKFVICVFLENNGSGHAASIVTKQIIETMIKENLI